MLRRLCKQTCLALYPWKCVCFPFANKFLRVPMGLWRIQRNKYFFSYIILPHFKTNNCIMWLSLVVSINIIILYFIKPLILFGNSIISYVLYWKHMKRFFCGQAEPEITVIQHSLYVRSRRKHEGSMKGFSELHILSIFPETLLKLRNCRYIALCWVG